MQATGVGRAITPTTAHTGCPTSAVKIPIRPETVAALKRIFPAAAPSDDSEAYGERDTFVGTAPLGYAAEHAQIFEPVERAYRLILELSALIALHVGAYG